MMGGLSDDLNCDAGRTEELMDALKTVDDVLNEFFTSEEGNEIVMPKDTLYLFFWLLCYIRIV